MKEHKIQRAFAECNRRFIVVPSGRRCLEEGTLVATPNGPVPIEELKIGDEVIGYNEFNDPEVTIVSATWDNGTQEVIPLYNNGTFYFSATENHQVLACHEFYFNKSRSHYLKEKYGYKLKPVAELTKRHRVKKQYVFDLIKGGEKHVSEAYVIGALLGNSCARDNKNSDGSHQKNIYISCEDNIVPKKIASILQCEYEPPQHNNHTYKLIIGKGALDRMPFYREWINGRYSHEKVVDYKEVESWDKESQLDFLAGVIDTDGSVYYDQKNSKSGIEIQIAMQAKSVIDACLDIIYKFFQEDFKIYIDDRGKYKNGPVHCILASSNLLACRVIDALRGRSFKCDRIDTSHVSKLGIKPDRAGFSKGDPYFANTYDITVCNNTNLYILHRGGFTIKNSGKTEIAKRKIIKHALIGSKFFPARYFVAAPVREQVRRIYWEDLKAMIPEGLLAHPPIESRLVISLINGSQIHLIGMDKPERIEGSPWDGGILDEFASMKERSWGAHVRPALSDRNGFCWFIGVPEGRGMYYEFFLKGKNGKDPDWKSFTWKSVDILDPDEVKKAQEELDELTFRQEYEGDFVSFSGRAYYSFDTNYNTAELEYFSHLPLIICFDFNVAPGVVSFIQEQDKERHYKTGQIHPKVKRNFTAIFDEIYFEKDSNTIKICNEVIKRYGEHKGEIHAYGDSTGGTSASAKILGSDWSLIENMLDGHFGDKFKMMVAAKNPLEKNRVTHLNSRIRAFDGSIGLLVDKEFAPKTFRDFSGVVFKGDGSGEIDKKTNPNLTHMCFGGDTIIDTEDCLICIKHLPEKGRIKTYNGEYVNFINPGSRGFKDTIKLIFNNGEAIVCTKDHLFLTNIGWVRAEDLIIDNIFLYDCKNIFIKSKKIDRLELAKAIIDSKCLFCLKVEQIIENGVQEVFCPTVETGCFTLFGQIVVSNSDAIGYYVYQEHPISNVYNIEYDGY
jgi:hypothetical protein